jgi:chromosome segregation ATPase
MALAASQADISQPEPTITVPLSDWNRLKGHLMKADASIENSTKSLEQANSLTMTQENELTELKAINSERTQALSELKAINEKQGKELEKASSKITEQEERLTLASNSLDELRNEIKNNRRTEQRLRRQRDTWAAGGVIGFLIGAAGAIR